MSTEEKPDEFNESNDVYKIHSKKLDDMIMKYYENHLPREKYDNILAFVMDLEKKIQITLPGTQLRIGGSIRNGFGTRDSDLDLVLCPADNTSKDTCDEIKMLAQLSHRLTEIGVPNKIAKGAVNFVKCNANNYLNRSIDIGYNKPLALCNVELLRKYCEWEPKRLLALGIWIKKWTQTCGIGKVVMGGFSSYAWIVILINYLQNCDPPVLPRLQEDFRTSGTKEDMLEDCDVYFHKIVEHNWSQNTKSVGALFLGFLEYLQNFNFQDEVIQIRRKEPVTKLEKRWDSILCIEDPFLLSWNMGERSPKASNKIWDKFQSAVQDIPTQDKRYFCPDGKFCPLCKGSQDCEIDCTLRPIRHPSLYKKEQKEKTRKKQLLEQEEKQCSEI